MSADSCYIYETALVPSQEWYQSAHLRLVVLIDSDALGIVVAWYSGSLSLFKRMQHVHSIIRTIYSRRAFRLTLPTFAIGLIVEEIIWAIVEEVLEEP